MHDSDSNMHRRRPSMDGFLSAPRSHNPIHRKVDADRFRSSGSRRIGDFKRPDGYHPAPQTKIALARPQHPAPIKESTNPKASILNMTLPGGFVDQERKAKDKTKNHRWRRIRKWGLRSGLAFGALLIVGGGLLGWQAYNKLHKVFKGGGTAAALQENVKPELLKGEGDGRINILLLGRGGDAHEGPDLTDTILIASIDPLNKTTHLVSIPRDLWVTVSGRGSSKINAVYANAKYRSLSQDSKNKQKADAAGIKAIEQVVTQVLGIPIHYYAMVDFQAFKEAVDTVGGVTLDVPEDLVDYSMAWENKRNPVLAKKGMQAFDGKHALMYVRSRHGSTRGDFDRTERQRLFLTALSQKVLSAGTYANPVKLTQLMNTFGNHVSTDFSVSDMLRLMTIAKSTSGKMTSVGLADPPNNFVRTDAMNNQSVVRPTAGFGDYSQIQAYIRNTLRDPFIGKENAKIIVLNGTSVSGLAAQKQQELQ